MIATSRAGDPSIVNYTMFVAVFSMLSLFYLIPAAIKDGFGVPVAMIALDVLNAIFYFCGAVALAAYLGVHSCSNGVSLHQIRVGLHRLTRLRTTRAATLSRMALPTQRSAAVKLRLPPLSCGLVSRASLLPHFSRGSRAVAA